MACALARRAPEGARLDRRVVRDTGAIIESFGRCNPASADQQRLYRDQSVNNRLPNTRQQALPRHTRDQSANNFLPNIRLNAASVRATDTKNCEPNYLHWPTNQEVARSNRAGRTTSSSAFILDTDIPWRAVACERRRAGRTILRSLAVLRELRLASQCQAHHPFLTA